MVSKKDRRHGGYMTPRATIHTKTAEDEAPFILPFYDDWQDYRDGQRDWHRDFKLIKQGHPRRSELRPDLTEKRQRMNRKQILLGKRRRRRKASLRRKVG